MKKEARLLKQKSLNSLILSIEHLNRPWDQGRTDAVLMFMDHSFEMLLKAGSFIEADASANLARRTRSALTTAFAALCPMARSSS